MTNPSKAPDTIVLIHGFWVTPRSWEHWIIALREPRLHGYSRRRTRASRWRSRRSTPTRRRSRPSPSRRSSAIWRSVGGRTGFSRRS